MPTALALAPSRTLQTAEFKFRLPHEMPESVSSTKHSTHGLQVVFSTRIISGSGDKTVQIWDAAYALGNLARYLQELFVLVLSDIAIRNGDGLSTAESPF